MKGIKMEFSVARNPQQNGVAERKNRTLIEAARTMLVDSKFLTNFWAEAINSACYVQNMVLVIKPHNKTPYELFLGRKPALSFMRPFAYPVTILNIIDHLGKFDEKADEGFLLGYSTNSKAFRVFNNRTRIVEENLHVQFIVARNQSNGNADPPFSSSPKDSPDAGFKPSREEEKKDAEDPGNEGGFCDVKCESGTDINNLDTYFQVSHVPTTIIHKDHPLNQVIGDLQSATQTRQMTKNLEEYGFVSTTLKQRKAIHRLQMLVCLLFMTEEPKKGNVMIFIFGSTKKKLCTKFEKMMHKKFQMSFMGELTFFLGLKHPIGNHKPFVSKMQMRRRIVKHAIDQ
ncbi:ribonuclease H-like domain-containing protein [Tanacetum coccineum]